RQPATSVGRQFLAQREPLEGGWNMRSTRIRALAAVVALVAAIPLATPVAAQDDDSSPQAVLDWNQNAVAAAGAAALPPPVASLVMAMVHGAIYDAVVSIAGGYQPYL